jgi:Protein of unknown function (DUF992)
MFNYRPMLTALVVVLAPSLPSPAQAQHGTNIGTLRCKLAPSIGLIVGSRQRMTCQFRPSGPFPPETYVGAITRIGLDIGISAGGALAWAVFAPTAGPLRGGLAGTYVGASGEIGVGVGAGANFLVGGSGRTVSLQPLSLEGSISLNLALGVAGLTLASVR